MVTRSTSRPLVLMPDCAGSRLPIVAGRAHTAAAAASCVRAGWCCHMERRPEMVTLWRCSQCGKWSHAKRRPKHHERAVYDEPVDSVRVLRVEPSVFEMDT